MKFISTKTLNIVMIVILGGLAISYLYSKNYDAALMAAIAILATCQSLLREAHAKFLRDL